MNSPFPIFFNELLYNGNFEIWSSGPDSLPDEWNDMTAGWQEGSGKETTIIKSGIASLRVIGNGLSFPTCVVLVNAMNFNIVNGKKVTFGCYVYATVANSIYLSLIDDSWILRNSPYHTGNGTWQWLEVSAIMYSPGVAYATLVVENTTTTVYFDGAQAHLS